MGGDLVAAFPAARQLYADADRLLGWSVADLSFGGPAERLNDTRYTQPALFVHSVAAGRVLLEAGARPVALAGHSLGEYSALALAGALSFEDGLHLVARRGAAMAEAATTSPGTMAAVLGLDADAVAEALAGMPDVVPANLNAPDQVVISGSVEGVRLAMERLAALGPKRIVPLRVSGAFHSPLMASAAEKVRAALDEVAIKRPLVPIVANVTGGPTTDPSEIRELLVRQITSPVRWTESVRTLAALGVRVCYEVGPGKVLQGLIRRIDRELEAIGAGTAAELNALQNG